MPSSGVKPLLVNRAELLSFHHLQLHIYVKENFIDLVQPNEIQKQVECIVVPYSVFSSEDALKQNTTDL